MLAFAFLFYQCICIVLLLLLHLLLPDRPVAGGGGGEFDRTPKKMSISTAHYSNIAGKALVSHHFLCVQCARLAIMAMAGRNRTSQILRLATGLPELQLRPPQFVLSEFS